MIRKQVSRQFVRVETGFPGLSDEETAVDVTRFDGRVPVKFKGKGDPPTDPFYIARDTWHALDDPDEITLTIVSNR